jgi:hypothetical protein
MAFGAQWLLVFVNYLRFGLIAIPLVLVLVLWRWRGNFARSVMWVLAGVSFALFLLASGLWWEASEGTRLSMVTPRSNELAQNVKDKLEGYEKRADDLEKLLSLLIAMTAIYGLALGLSAYLQAKESAEKLEAIRKDAIQQANDSGTRLKQIEDDARREAQKLPTELKTIRDEAQHSVEQFVERARSRFPILEDMDNGIRSMVVRITRLLPVIDWTDENFRRLQAQDKQEILYYEKAIAALEPFDLRSVRRDVSEIFHGLGNFYGLKYSTEKEEKKKEPQKPAPLDDDKERSRFYLERSLSQDPINVGALNDRVFFALNIDPGPEEYKKALDLCQASLKSDPEQQRARYNLALLEHTFKKDYRRSEELLTEALDRKTWQLERPAGHHFSILYNRACARARLRELAEAIQDLEEAIPAAMPTDSQLKGQFLADIRLLKATLPGDLEAPKPDNPGGGDFYELSIDGGCRLRVQEVVDRLKGF